MITVQKKRHIAQVKERRISENKNPKERMAEDCVFRAIAGATERSWEEVYAGLCEIGLTLHSMPNFPIVFRAYLQAIGATSVYKREVNWRRLYNDAAYKRQWEAAGISVLDFAKSHPSGNYVVRVEWHVTCVRNGIIYDYVPCQQGIVIEAWEVTAGMSYFKNEDEKAASWVFEK